MLVAHPGRTAILFAFAGLLTLGVGTPQRPLSADATVTARDSVAMLTSSAMATKTTARLTCRCCIDQGGVPPTHLFLDDPIFNCADKGCEIGYTCLKSNQKDDAPEGGPPSFHHNEEDWTCADAHRSCTASLAQTGRAQIVALIKNKQYRDAAEMINASNGEASLNFDRSLLQIFDCSGRVESQVTVDRHVMQSELDQQAMPKQAISLRKSIVKQRDY